MCISHCLSFPAGSSTSSEEEIIVVNPFEKWFEATRRKEITLVTAGRSGVGKSTLVQNLLRLTGEADLVPQSRHSPSSVTTEVKVYSSYRAEEEVTIRMIDMPGLFTSDVNDSRVLAELQEKTGGRCDMMLYCVSLLPDSKIDKEDEQIIDKLTRVFGKEVLEHTLLVLTFANAVKELYPDQSIEDLVDEYGKKFQSMLRRSISVVSLYSCDHQQNLTRRDPSIIVALPAGRNPDERFVHALPVGWDETIFLEVLNKCEPDSIPQLLLARTPKVGPLYTRVPRLVCGFVLLTGLVVGTLGQFPGLILAFFGYKTGELIESLTGRVGARLGALIGYVSALSLFGAYGGYYLFVDLLRNEIELQADRRELGEIQKEIVRYRSSQQAYCRS